MLMMKAIKDLDYWKKKLIGILNKAPMEKSLKDILFPNVMLKSLPVETQNNLEKARGYGVGTIRTWSGKKYKKLSSGKWMRTYSGTGERGEQQAIRNVMSKIQKASSMEDLSKIVSENMQRFKGDDGKTLPIVKEFMASARGTDSGKKQVKVKKPEDKKQELLDSTEMKKFASMLSTDEKTLQSMISKNGEIPEYIKEKYSNAKWEDLSRTQVYRMGGVVALNDAVRSKGSSDLTRKKLVVENMLRGEIPRYDLMDIKQVKEAKEKYFPKPSTGSKDTPKKKMVVKKESKYALGKKPDQSQIAQYRSEIISEMQSQLGYSKDKAESETKTLYEDQTISNYIEYMEDSPKQAIKDYVSENNIERQSKRAEARAESSNTRKSRLIIRRK